LVKIHIHFQTKTAKKPYPLRTVHTYRGYIRENTPFRELDVKQNTKEIVGLTTVRLSLKQVVLLLRKENKNAYHIAGKNLSRITLT